MADPLSLAASIIAVATVAANVTTTLSKLRGLYNFPGRLHVIHNEVADLEVVLHQVSALVERRKELQPSRGTPKLALVVEQANSKLLHLQTIVDDLIARCVGDGKFYTRTKAWLKERQRLETLQDELHIIKANLNIMLGATHSQDMIRVQLDLQSVSLVTDSVSRQQVTFQQGVNEKLQQNHLHVQQRLDALEQLMRDHFLRLQSNLNAELGPGFVRTPAQRTPMAKPPDRTPNRGGVTIHASQRIGVFCDERCFCACHRRQEIRTPDIIRPILGHLFIGYCGLPSLRPPCDNARCKKRQSTTIKVEYWFPLWLLAQVIQLVYALQPAARPQLQLRTLMQVPDSAQCVTFALNGNIEGIKGLFARGLASVHDVSQSRNYTMLRWAVYGKQLETCKFLLEAGADPEEGGSSDRLWDFALRGSLTDDDIGVVQSLLDRSDYREERKFPLLHRIVLSLSLHHTLAGELERNPEAIHDTDLEGRTALSWAAARGDERSVITLLAHGADPNVTDITGITPLYLAANEGRPGCTRLLLEAGALPDPVKIKGKPSRSTPLLCTAMCNSDPLVMKTLLDFGANLEARSPDGETPLLAVARAQTAVMALLLMESGANLNACSPDGKTPLTTAIAYNNHGVLHVLLTRWHQYRACPRLAGPNLLQIAADYADAETLSILASAEHFRLREDRRYVKAVALEVVHRLEQRPDWNEELSAAFEELLFALGHGKASPNVDLLLEGGLLRRDTGMSSSTDDGALDLFEDAIDSLEHEKLEVTTA